MFLKLTLFVLRVSFEEFLIYKVIQIKEKINY